MDDRDIILPRGWSSDFPAPTDKPSVQPVDPSPLLERIAELEAERDRLRHNVRCLRLALETIRNQAGVVLLDPVPVFVTTTARMEAPKNFHPAAEWYANYPGDLPADTPHVREAGPK